MKYTTGQYMQILAVADNMRSKLALRQDIAAVYWTAHFVEQIRTLRLAMEAQIAGAPKS